MNHMRRRRTVLAVLACVSLIGACTSKSSGGGKAATPTGTSPAVAAALGAPNPATGTPLKLGYVDDGVSAQLGGNGVWQTANAAAEYANEYLNGINGHKIVLDRCSTGFTPSGGTACGVQMVRDKVVALLSSLSSEDQYVHAAVANSGIPYFTETSAQTDILASPGAYLIWSILGTLSAEIPLAKDAGVKKAGIVIIDVPAAQGVKPIVQPLFAKAGLTLDFVAISASVPDQTGRLQQAINSGDGAFYIVGSSTFVLASIKALKQLAFKGPIMLGLSPVPKAVVDGVPGGLAGIYDVVSETTDPTDPDVKLYAAVKAKYTDGNLTGDAVSGGFATVLGFVRALTGHPAAIDATSIKAALSAMPSPVRLPLGGGITFQCGSKPIPITPNDCTSQYLQTVLDKDGNPTTFTLRDSKSLFAN